MASLSNLPTAEANSLGKREAEDELDTKPILKKHKEEDKHTTIGFADNLDQSVELLETKLSDKVNVEGLVDGFVSDTAHSVDHSVELFETKSHKETVGGEGEGLVEFIEAIAVSKKTLFANNLYSRIKISSLIDFFKDVGKIVRVQLVLNSQGERTGRAFLEFASANEANEALVKKNGLSLYGYNIILLRHSEMAPYPLRPKYFIEHKVWDKDYLRPTEEEETPSLFFEAVAVREKTKTLFFANLSPQTTMPHIVKFFKSGAESVKVRLIVNHEGEHVGYGFVEFETAYLANQALETKNGEYLHDHPIFLHVPIKTAPYSPQDRYNLAEKLWYKDCLRGDSHYLLIDDEETPNFVEAVALRKKTLFSWNYSRNSKISDIIKFFKDVGQVVHVRFIVNRKGKHHHCALVEFASVNEAEKALEKNGECLHGQRIYLREDNEDSYPLGPKYCMDHKVWYEDYLGREGLLIEEDEGFDETRDFVKAMQMKTGKVLSGRQICVYLVNTVPYPLRPKNEDYLGREEDEDEEDDLETKPTTENKLFDLFCGKKITFSDED